MGAVIPRNSPEPCQNITNQINLGIFLQCYQKQIHCFLTQHKYGNMPITLNGWNSILEKKHKSSRQKHTSGRLKYACKDMLRVEFHFWANCYPSNTSEFPIGKLSDVSFPCSPNFELKFQNLKLCLSFYLINSLLIITLIY